MATVQGALARLEEGYRADGLARAARAMLAERARLGAAAGVPVDLAADDCKPGRIEPRAPDCGPWVGLFASGLEEAYWAPEKTEERGLWHVDPAGLLVLGRRKPLESLTGFTRDADIRQTYVRAREWFAGTYTLRVRVRFVSAHLTGGIVIGETRHDRGLYVSLGGGDWAYAVGRKKEGARFRGLHVGLDDLRAYDRGVGRMRRQVSFESPKTSVVVTVRVSGPFVRVRIDGRDVLSHRTTTGLPIEGRIGFHLGSGLAAFERPEVARHRAVGPAATCPCEHADRPLDFSRPVAIPWGTWAGRRVVGLEPDPKGMVVLLYPEGGAWAKEDSASQTVAIWRKVLGGAHAAHLCVLRPRGGAKPPLPWGGSLSADALVPHAGLPAVEAAHDAWMGHEAANRAARKRSLNERVARSDVEAEVRIRPPWIAIDPRGVVRATGFWIEDWHRGRTAISSGDCGGTEGT